MANLDPVNKFKPGQSGNPGGRPKIPEELRHRLKEYSETAFKYLAAVAAGKEPKARVADRIRACEVLIERAYGKTSQPLCIDEDGNEIVIRLAGNLVEWSN